MSLEPVSVGRRVLAVLAEARDVLDERVDTAPPSWSERRGWTRFLLDLDAGELARCEAEGLSRRAPRLPGIPPSLAELAAAVGEAEDLPFLNTISDHSDTGAAGTRAASSLAVDSRKVRARKRPQLVGLAGVIATMAERAARIVDVGSGSGHFTALAAELFEREAVGLERRRDRVIAARERVISRERDIEARGGSARPSARFVEVDASREPLGLSQDDLAVGLHACGALGDRLVEAVAAAGAELALVSCCLQKIDGPERAPLSRAFVDVRLRREVLGLTNLTSQARGVEVSIEETMAARQARFALLSLLRRRGLSVSPGEEMRGVNRRRARGGLAEIAAKALAARGLDAATADEIVTFEAEAERQFGAVRRLSLPRNMLARVVEMAVVLDRAALLAERGHHVRVGLLFDRSVSPRNIAILASRDESRLPRG